LPIGVLKGTLIDSKLDPVPPWPIVSDVGLSEAVIPDGADAESENVPEYQLCITRLIVEDPEAAC